MAIPVATTGREMFGGAGYVAAGYFGSGFWVNVGLAMRVAWKPESFNNILKNEAGQIMTDSINMSAKSGSVTLTLRRHSAEIIAGLIPGLTKTYDATSSKQAAYGWNPDPGPITPIGLHIRPQHAYGTSTENHADCWYVPSIVFSDLGEFIHKMEDSDEVNEDYEISFMSARLLQDYTPGSPQQISRDGQLLFQGDSTHFVTNTWEEHLPFGFVKGRPGFPTISSVSAITNSGATVNITPPASDAGRSLVTGYKVQTRVRDSGSAFTEADAGANADTLAITGLSSDTEYEVRMYATATEGNGAMSTSRYFRTSS